MSRQREERSLERPEPEAYAGKMVKLWHYSVALDEIYRHRSEMLVIAMEMEHLLGFKSTPKAVEKGIRDTIKLLRQSGAAVNGRWYLQPDMVKAARERAHVGQTMTRAQFEEEKGLV